MYIYTHHIRVYIHIHTYIYIYVWQGFQNVSCTVHLVWTSLCMLVASHLVELGLYLFPPSLLQQGLISKHTDSQKHSFKTGNKAPAHHGTHHRGAQSSSRSWSCVALIASCKPGERIRKKQWTFNFRLEQLHGTFRGRYMPRLIRSRVSFHWDGLKV